MSPASRNLPHALAVVGPDSGQEVGLKLEPHREVVGLGAARLLHEPLHLLTDAEQVLDMMAHLVREDVGLSEVPGGSEPPAEHVVEAQVDVHLLVERAVEGADRRARESAGGLDGPREQDEPRLAVGLAHALELHPPDVFGVGEDDRDELPELLLGRIHGAGAGAGAWRRVGLNAWVLDFDLIEESKRIGAKEHRDEEDDEEAGAASEHHASRAHSPAVFDILAAAAILPAHLDSPFGLWDRIEHQACTKAGRRRHSQQSGTAPTTSLLPASASLTSANNCSNIPGDLVSPTSMSDHLILPEC